MVGGLAQYANLPYTPPKGALALMVNTWTPDVEQVVTEFDKSPTELWRVAYVAKGDQQWMSIRGWFWHHSKDPSIDPSLRPGGSGIMLNVETLPQLEAAIARFKAHLAITTIHAPT